MTRTPRKPPQTFGSADDLPTVQELRAQLGGFKLLKLVLSAKQKLELKKLETDLDDIVRVVDDFYELLGARNWVYHDDLNIPAIRKIIATGTPEGAELQLISYYQDRDAMKFPLLRLGRLPAIRPRLDLVRKAYEDYQEGRYYSTTLVLIAVMDGTVNDVNQAQRKGLHAREADEMVAWDSVTAHHLGLKHAHYSFTKSFRKTTTDEVTELYRNGIVHGTVVNFDNIVVATKALNRLFAVTDWANSLLDQGESNPPEPTLREFLAKRAETQRDMKLIDAFSPSEKEITTINDDDDDVVSIANDFLYAWQMKNYGGVGQAFMKFGGAANTNGQSAGEAKSLYRDFDLTAYRLKRVQYSAVCVTLINADLTVNSREHAVVLRWVHSNDQGEPTTPSRPGAWRLAPYGPTTFIEQSSSSST